MYKNDILIVCALEQETQEELNDWEPFTDDPVWNVLYTGVGKVNATLKLTQRLQVNRSLPPMPKVVINYGTAGSRELPVGELVDCTRFIQRDMNATSMGFFKGQTPFESPDDIVLDSNSEFNLIDKHYVCGTGDNFVENMENEIDYIDVFDMEAYALAKVCYHYDIPFISFKYITDNVDEHSAGDWVDNCSDGVREFKEKVLDLIEKN